MLLTCFLSATDSSQSENVDHLQKKLIERFFMLTKPASESFDECASPYTMCNSDAMVTSVHVNQENSAPKDRLTLYMKWAPQTLQYVHMKSTKFSGGITTSALPRNLRYFYMVKCFCIGQERYHLDMRKLPKNLEEFIISGGSISGPFILTALPDSLQVLIVNASTLSGPSKVYANFAELPKGLIFAFITTTGKHTVEPRLSVVGKTKKDDRVLAGSKDSVYGWFTGVVEEKFRNSSKYYAGLNERAKMGIWAEKNAH